MIITYINFTRDISWYVSSFKKLQASLWISIVSLNDISLSTSFSLLPVLDSVEQSAIWKDRIESQNLFKNILQYFFQLW